MLRTATLIIAGLTTAFWLWIVTIAILTNLGPRDNWIAMMLLMISSGPFIVFALPALALALKRKFLGLALALALLSLISIILVA